MRDSPVRIILYQDSVVDDSFKVGQTTQVFRQDCLSVSQVRGVLDCVVAFSHVGFLEILPAPMLVYFHYGCQPIWLGRKKVWTWGMLDQLSAQR